MNRLGFLRDRAFPIKNETGEIIRIAGIAEDITARKKAETLLDIPVAVTAFSADDIEAKGIEGLADVALFTPGLTYFEALNSALGTPVVRGIAQTNLNSPDRNVAVFYGGVYLSNLNATNLEILDVERIEVVKGPQSALYGRNAFNGANKLTLGLFGANCSSGRAVTGLSGLLFVRRTRFRSLL